MKRFLLFVAITASVIMGWSQTPDLKIEGDYQEQVQCCGQFILGREYDELQLFKEGVQMFITQNDTTLNVALDLYDNGSRVFDVCFDPTNISLIRVTRQDGYQDIIIEDEDLHYLTLSFQPEFNAYLIDMTLYVIGGVVQR